MKSIKFYVKKWFRLVFNFQKMREFYPKPKWYNYLTWHTARAIRNMSILTTWAGTSYFSAIFYNAAHPVVVHGQEIVKTVEIPITPDFPSMLQRICNAEVTGNPNTMSHQFNKDGSVVRGRVNASDVGYCQVNEAINNDLARKMGYDIFTEQGNKDFAVYLFNTRGTEPWNSSKSMWCPSCKK